MESPSGRLASRIIGARRHRGFSRETLASRTGLSFAGVVQIESGRRREVRLSTLAAIAGALGVSMEYLTGASPQAPTILEHVGLSYSTDEEYVGVLAGFLGEGIDRDEAVLVVTTSRKIDLLRDALGDLADRIDCVDSVSWYVSLDQALGRYRRYIADYLDKGRCWVRVVGEPAWVGQSKAAVLAWRNYESLANIALSAAPATLICPYDTRSLPLAAVAAMHQTHPRVVDAGTPVANDTYIEPTRLLLEGD